MNDESKAAGKNPPADADLVVVDRTTLKELLSAVVNTLKASENIDAMLEPAEGDEGDYAEVRQAIASARAGLISGIERIAAAVDELPNAVIDTKQMNT